MAHRATGADDRSVTEILADARELQERHGPGVLDVAVRWVREQFAVRAGAVPARPSRQLVLH